MTHVRDKVGLAAAGGPTLTALRLDRTIHPVAAGCLAPVRVASVSYVTLLRLSD